MHRRPSTQDITWLLDLHTNKQLDLNPPYQRRSVWTRKDKQFFLDTIREGIERHDMSRDHRIEEMRERGERLVLRGGGTFQLADVITGNAGLSEREEASARFPW